MKSLVLLLGASVALWGALLYPGWRLWGEIALVHSATAWALVVLPGLAATIWALRRDMTPEMRVTAVLAGSGIRLVTTLGGGMLLTEVAPETYTKVFWLWVGVFYMALLTLEVLVLVRQDKTSEQKTTSIT